MLVITSGLIIGKLLSLKRHAMVFHHFSIVPMASNQESGSKMSCEFTTGEYSMVGMLVPLKGGIGSIFHPPGSASGI